MIILRVLGAVLYTLDKSKTWLHTFFLEETCYKKLRLNFSKVKKKTKNIYGLKILKTAK